MARKPTGNPAGAPSKQIDWDLFEKLCGIMCTQDEIAGTLKIHDDTLRNRVKGNYGEDYSTVYKKFSANGKISLRRNQFVLAKTNTTMAIWLGKQWLGQKDDPSDTHQKQNQLVQTLLDAIMAKKEEKEITSETEHSE